MKCWNCGQEVADEARFCNACGAALSAEPEGAVPPTPEAPVPPTPETPVTPTNGGGGDASLVLKVFAGVCAAVYAVLALTRIPGLFRGIGSIFTNLFSGGFAGVLLGVVSLVSTVVDVLVIVGYVWMAAVMVLMILKRTPENADGLLALTVGGAAVVVALQLVSLLVGLLLVAALRMAYGGWVSIELGSVVWAHTKSIFLHLLGGGIAAGGAYLILRFVMGESPLAGKDFKTLTEEAKVAVGELTHKASEAAQEAKAKREAQQTAQAQQTQAASAQPAASAPAARPRTFRLKTNRSLIMYILLNIVTCGIYGWVFIYGLAQDVNTACAGDGKTTGGLLKFILLNFITCNIYSWVWYYGLGNRLAANAPRYGLNFQENGTTILLWMLVGALLCGIGPLVALHIICRNTNAICAAYNNYNQV